MPHLKSFWRIMIKVNILNSVGRGCFLRQLDKERFPASEYYFVENSQEDILWDLVVVYESLRHIQKIRVKKGGLLFIAGEPPMSRVYPQAFLDQFDWIITSHSNLKHPHNCLVQQMLDWHYGFKYSEKTYSCDFSRLKNMPCPEKKLAISVITSNQTMMPGHNRRMKLLKRLKEDFGNKIDFYGKGIKFVDDKADALNPYYFHLCIENSNVNHYWTEKIADPILAFSIPIYIGAPNISDYFDIDGILQFDINDYEPLRRMISVILSNPKEEYDKHYDGLLKNRFMLLNVYNFFPYVMEFYNRFIKSKYSCIVTKELKPCFSFPSYGWELYGLRIKRFFCKKYYQLTNCNIFVNK